MPADMDSLTGLVAIASALAAAFFWGRSFFLKPPNFDRVTTFIQPDDCDELPFGLWEKRIANYNKWASLFVLVAVILVIVRGW